MVSPPPQECGTSRASPYTLSHYFLRGAAHYRLMNKMLSLCVLAVIAATGCVSAQTQDSPSPAALSPMQQARSDAKTASWNAISADHQTKIQAIVDGFNNGTLDIPTASAQIDAVLTPDETTAVQTQAQKLRDAMRAAYSANGASAGGPPAGGRFGGGRRGGNRMGTQKPDVGRFLLGLNADPDKWSAAMQALRANGGGQTPP
jgi:hypothetical protein